MFKQKKLSIFVSGALMVMAGTTQAIAADTRFDNFTALPGSVAAGLLPESTPFQLSSPDFSQVRIADRTTQLGLGIANTGSWDMITANETGPDAGRYLFSPFETSMAGVQRTDLTTGLTKTIVQPGTQGFVSGDASRWTPWGSYLTAEESWGAGSTKGRLFELTNPVTATGTGDSNFVNRSILPHVSQKAWLSTKTTACTSSMSLMAAAFTNTSPPAPMQPAATTISRRVRPSPCWSMAAATPMRWVPSPGRR